MSLPSFLVDAKPLTHDELERLAKYLAQGLDLERETVRRLVAQLMRSMPPRTHDDGCAWWRGAGCDCAAAKPWEGSPG